MGKIGVEAIYSGHEVFFTEQKQAGNDLQLKFNQKYPILKS
jgi:hypothetical protein